MASFVLCGGLGGCAKSSRQLTERDCKQVGERLEQAWLRDSVAAAAQADSPEARVFAKDEQRRIGAAWNARCAAWVGRVVEPAELTCLGRADTIDDVYSCAGGR